MTAAFLKNFVNVLELNITIYTGMKCSPFPTRWNANVNDDDNDDDDNYGRA